MPLTFAKDTTEEEGIRLLCFGKLLSYADKPIVNIMKVYIEKNNLQVELIRCRSHLRRTRQTYNSPSFNLVRFGELLSYADKPIVNIMKVYIAKNNLQVELIRCRSHLRRTRQTYNNKIFIIAHHDIQWHMVKKNYNIS